MHDAPAPLRTSIRIFLANGGADGAWDVERSNWTGKALMAPRTRYKELRSRPDLDGPGVYLLIGPTESGVPATRIYIGETDEQPSRTVELHLAGKGAAARGTEVPDGFVVFAGSLARHDEVPSIHVYGTQLRTALLDSGRLVADGDHLRLTEDYVFSSPSTAAMVMLGRTANGRIEWKTADGLTLKALQGNDAGDPAPA